MNWDLPIFASLNGLIVDTLLFVLVVGVVGVTSRLKKIEQLLRNQSKSVRINRTGQDDG